LAYLAVAFLFVCTIPLAFSGNGSGTILEHSDNGVGGFQVTPLIALLIIPIVALVFVMRTATMVSEDGIRVRAVFGSRFLPWKEIRGISAEKRAVYAVIEGGAVRLPCVRVADLWLVTRASGGHLPQIDSPLVKSAPTKQRPIYLRKTD
jgi:hypothetical protein